MRFVLFLILLCITLSSCVYTTEPISTGNFPANVSVILQANCMGGNCHSGADSLNAEFDLSSWSTMTKGSVYFNEIIPYSALKSHFFGHINTDPNVSAVFLPTMPLARDPLSANDQLTIFNWINQGAKSADGKIPYSDVTKKIFVVNQNDDMVSIIDADIKKWVRVISVGTKNLPSAITMTADRKACIVAMDGTNGLVRKYDASSYNVEGEFQSNLVPSAIALTPDGSKGYITDESYFGNRFGIFDPIGMKLLKTISSPLIIDPISIAVAPDGKYVYICGHGSDNIIRVDAESDSILGCLVLGTDVEVPPTSTYARKYLPQKVLISSDSKTMYVTCENSSEVVVFDLTRDTIIARIPTPYLPWGAALRPNTSELWTATLGANAVHVISTTTNQVIAEIDSISQYPHAITFTSDGAYAYVACELSAGGAHHHGTGGVPPSSYVVIDCKTRKVISIQELPALSVDIMTGY